MKWVESIFGVQRIQQLQRCVTSLPFASVVVLFVVFRARTQLIAEEDSSYQVAIAGFVSFFFLLETQTQTQAHIFTNKKKWSL